MNSTTEYAETSGKDKLQTDLSADKPVTDPSAPEVLITCTHPSVRIKESKLIR